MPNDRQLASLILIAAFAAWALSRADIRGSALSVLRLFVSPKLLIPTLAFTGYVVGVVWAGRDLGLWTPTLVTDTAFWFVSGGLVMYFNMQDVSKREGYVRRTVLETLGLTVVLAFLSNIFVLPLWAELIVQPIIVLFALMAVVAGTNDEYRAVKRLSNVMVALAGFSLLAFSLVRLVEGWHQIAWGQQLRQFVLPVWLTAAAIPFVYVVNLAATYELINTRMRLADVGRIARWRGIAALTLVLRGRSRALAGFVANWPRRLGEAESFRAARGVVASYLDDREQTRQAELDRRQALAKYAGVQGEDDEGRQLDRREFRESQKALYWLATCQMGWFNNRGGLYRPELLGMLEFRDLGENHGIEMVVREDGQAWYAWRRMPSGWHFGIGASGPPPDQWLGEGADPPPGFPKPGEWWGSGPFGLDATNWCD